jgi:hypothetical protein
MHKQQANAVGYEDFDNHNRLGYEVVMGVRCEKSGPRGTDRMMRKRNRGNAIDRESALMEIIACTEPCRR